MGEAMVDVATWRGPTREAMAALRRNRGETMFGWPADPTCDWCGDTGGDLTGEPCRCAAGEAEAGRRTAEQRDAMVAAGWRTAGFPTRVCDWRLESSPNADAVGAVAAWCDGPAPAAGGVLLLTGRPGTGKTGLAVGAARRLQEADPTRSVRWWVAPDLLDRLRPGGDPDGLGCLADAKACDVLVLDELTIETSTEWVKERLYVLLNHRYLERRPTVVTSNHDLPRMARAIGDRLVSRLTEAPSATLRIDGPDYRQLTA